MRAESKKFKSIQIKNYSKLSGLISIGYADIGYHYTLRALGRLYDLD